MSCHLRLLDWWHLAQGFQFLLYARLSYTDLLYTCPKLEAQSAWHVLGVIAFSLAINMRFSVHFSGILPYCLHEATVFVMKMALPSKPYEHSHAVRCG